MTIQLVIILSYFALTVVIGLISQRKSKSATAFHGAGLGIMLCVCAGTGEWLGGTSTTGISEYGYSYGISGSWYTLANGIGVIFLALLFARLYRSLETVTVPGIIEKFIGVSARVASSVLLTFVMLAVGISQMIAAGTLGVSILGLDFNISVIAFAVIFIIYTLAGGMNAVASTNMLHLFSMYGGVLLAIFLALKGVGGMKVVSDTLPASYFSMTGIGMPKVSSWVIASLLGACTAQAGIQPILAAKDVKVARRSAIITAFVVAPFGLLTALLGMIAKVQFPDLENAKLALPTLMMNLPPVAGGLVLASILAAVLSTVSPIILASGTLITKDVYHRVVRPKATDEQVLKVSKITTAVSGVICAAAAILMYGTTRILDIVYFAYSIRGALFVVLLFSICWKKVSEKSAVFSMVITAIVGFFWVAYNALSGSFPIHQSFTETYAAVLTATIATLVFSHIFPKKENGLNVEK